MYFIAPKHTEDILYTFIETNKQCVHRAENAIDCASLLALWPYDDTFSLELLMHYKYPHIIYEYTDNGYMVEYVDERILCSIYDLHYEIVV